MADAEQSSENPCQRSDGSEHSGSGSASLSDASDASSADGADAESESGWLAAPAIEPAKSVVKPASAFLKKGKSRTRSIDKETMNMCRVTVAKVLKSNYWDLFTCLVVICDITLTCVDIDYRANDWISPPWIGILSTTCLILYVCELLANLAVRDWAFLKEIWAVLDVLIILSGLAEVVLDSVGMGADSFGLLRVLRLVRIMRLFRLFRKFSLLKEFRKLLLMIVSCFKTLFWSFLFCFICMAAWSMLAVEMLHPIMDELEAEWRDCTFCARSLSTVMDANLLLFKTLVALDSWGKVALPVIQHTPSAAIIFCGSQLTIVFGILNLIVAVVVDQFAEQRTKDVTNMANDLEQENDEELRRLDKMFQLIDGDGDGELTLVELLEGATKSKEFQNRLRVMDIDQADLFQLFSMLDADGGGTIDPEEFKQTLARWNMDAKTSNRFIRYALQQLMKDHANAAQRLCVMEERLSAALYREQAAVRKEERRKGKLLRGLRLAQRFRDLRALPAHKRSSKEVQINDFTVLHGDNFGPKCWKPSRPNRFMFEALQPSVPSI